MKRSESGLYKNVNALSSSLKQLPQYCTSFGAEVQDDEHMSASISNAFNITKLNLHERNKKGKSTKVTVKRRTLNVDDVNSTRTRPNMQLKKSMLP